VDDAEEDDAEEDNAEEDAEEDDAEEDAEADEDKGASGSEVLLVSVVGVWTNV